MALGRRCDLGCESWPDDDAYKVCPVCGEKTKQYTNLDPLDDEDARQAAFEAFYRDHCERNGMDVDGPLPDGFSVPAT